MPCEALVLHTRPDVPSSGMMPSGAAQARQKPFAPRPGAASLPVYEYQCRPVVAVRPLPSPQPFFSPLSKAPPRALAAVRKCARTALRPQRMPAQSPGPAQKKRNFLDLWQTIAQDLSRLFAVPGGCPSCPGSRKDCPSPCPASAAPCPLRDCGPQPSGKRFALSGRNTMHTPTRTGRHGRGVRPSTVQPYHSTGGPERDGCPRRCDTVPWT